MPVKSKSKENKEPKFKEIREINGAKVICLNDACTEYRFYEDTGNLEIVPRDKCILQYQPEDLDGFKDELLNLTTEMLRKKGKQRIVFERDSENEE